MDTGLLAGIVIGVVAVWALLLVLFWVFRPRGVPAREIVRIVPDVVRLIRDLVTDRTTPIDVRVVLVGLLVWIVSPIDLIPEFLPVLGPLDDGVVAIVAMRFTRRRLGTERLRAQWRGTADGLAMLERLIGTSEPES
ncbi:MAG: DUF1232 domain-containing protein [Chloroflexi bacterium]|nr:DUF1232 domain-containing protein [Chloroflexota bacterium]